MLLSKSLNAALTRVRPLPVAESGVALGTLVGWYMRKGLGTGLRGFIQHWRFKGSPWPFFLGGGAKISYAAQMSLGKNCLIGANSVILAFSKSGVNFGDCVTLRENAWIQCSSSPSNPGEGLVIGSNTYIGPGATIGVGGKITIGSGCLLGANVTLIAEDHATGSDGRPSRTEVTRAGIIIGDGTWLGHGVTVLDGVTLGEGCVVGAGAVVTHSFSAFSRIAGVPARSVNVRS